MFFKRIAVAGIAAAALAVGSLGAATAADASVAAPAHAAIAPVSFTNNYSGEAGVLLAEDNHTHYRYIQSVTQAEPVLSTLNEVTTPSATPADIDAIGGAQGEELCDPNTGFDAEAGLFYDQGTEKYYVGWADGYFNSDAVADDTDVCASGGLLLTITETGTAAPVLTPATPQLPAGDGPAGPNTIDHYGLIPISVTQGNMVLTSVYFNAQDRHGHDLSFQVANQSTGWARSVQVKTSSPEFWEAGAGAFTPNIGTNAFDAISPINITDVLVNYYSSAKPAYPIYTEQPYFGVGGVVAVSATNGTATISPVELTTSSFNLTESEG